MTSVLKDDLEELLNCSICLGTFTEPKLLSCAHRYCKTCLLREMDRSASAGANPSFPCPMCKRSIQLPRGRCGNEWIDGFETDRLLKDILEKVGDTQEICQDGCRPHRTIRKVVCHSCMETGCLKCAWEKHRYCDRVLDYQSEVERVTRDILHHTKKVETYLNRMRPFLRNWSRVSESFETQAQYSNKFIDQCIQKKRDRYGASYTSMIASLDSYTRKASMSGEYSRQLQDVMAIVHAKLDIAKKSQKTAICLKCQVSEHMRKALSQGENARQLTTLLQDMFQTLKMNTHEMVIKGEQLLTTNSEMLSDRFHKGYPRIPISYLIDGLITREDQVDLGIKREEKLLSQLVKIIEEADDRDPEILLVNLQGLCPPQKPQTEMILRNHDLSSLSAVHSEKHETERSKKIVTTIEQNINNKELEWKENNVAQKKIETTVLITALALLVIFVCEYEGIGVLHTVISILHLLYDVCSCIIYFCNLYYQAIMVILGFLFTVLFCTNTYVIIIHDVIVLQQRHGRRNQWQQRTSNN